MELWTQRVPCKVNVTPEERASLTLHVTRCVHISMNLRKIKFYFLNIQTKLSTPVMLKYNAFSNSAWFLRTHETVFIDLNIQCILKTLLQNVSRPVWILCNKSLAKSHTRRHTMLPSTTTTPANIYNFSSEKVVNFSALHAKGDFITLVHLRPMWGKSIYLTYQYYWFSCAPPPHSSPGCAPGTGMTGKFIACTGPHNQLIMTDLWSAVY